MGKLVECDRAGRIVEMEVFDGFNLEMSYYPFKSTVTLRQAIL